LLLGQRSHAHGLLGNASGARVSVLAPQDVERVAEVVRDFTGPDDGLRFPAIGNAPDDRGGDMASNAELIELERAAWEALSTSGEAATKYYADVLADDVLIVMPGGMVIDDRDQVIGSMKEADWASFDMSGERVLELSDSSAALVYEVVARREGAEDYHALLNSTYVKSGGDWKLTLHQQTPA
jgi:hypothetical protein